MTRIRSIKPEMPGNHRVAQVSRDARLMLVWLITDADDEGRLPATPKRLAGQLFPHDEDVNSEQILAWLLELETAGLIVQYSVKGAPFVEICGWFEHQKISKPSPSRFPPRYAADFWDETANCQVNDGPRETQGNPGKPRETQADLGSRIIGPRTANGAEQSDLKLTLVRELDGVATAPLASKKKMDAVVVEVFEYWRIANKKTSTVVLSDKRAKLIATAVKTYGIDDAKRAIDNNATDRWACDSGKHEIEFVLRADWIEVWRDKRPAKPVPGVMRGEWVDGGDPTRDPTREDVTAGRFERYASF